MYIPCLDCLFGPYYVPVFCTPPDLCCTTTGTLCAVIVWLNWHCHTVCTCLMLYWHTFIHTLCCIAVCCTLCPCMHLCTHDFLWHPAQPCCLHHCCYVINHSSLCNIDYMLYQNTIRYLLLCMHARTLDDC